MYAGTFWRALGFATPGSQNQFCDEIFWEKVEKVNPSGDFHFRISRNWEKQENGKPIRIFSPVNVKPMTKWFSQNILQKKYFQPTELDHSHIQI